MSEANATAGPSNFRGHQPIAPAPPEPTHAGKYIAQFWLYAVPALKYSSILHQHPAVVGLGYTSTHERSNKPLPKRHPSRPRKYSRARLRSANSHCCSARLYTSNATTADYACFSFADHHAPSALRPTATTANHTASTTFHICLAFAHRYDSPHATDPCALFGRCRRHPYVAPRRGGQLRGPWFWRRVPRRRRDRLGRLGFRGERRDASGDTGYAVAQSRARRELSVRNEQRARYTRFHDAGPIPEDGVGPELFGAGSSLSVHHCEAGRTHKA